MALPLLQTSLVTAPNLLLTALPEADYGRLAPYLKIVHLAAGHTLCEAGEPMQRVYFPIDCTVSLLMSSEQGTDVEVGTIGREGLIDVTACLGGGPSLYRAEVLTRGMAWQMPADILKQEFRRGGALHQQLLTYMQNMLAQSSQTVLCCRLHTIEARLARWLLGVHDRVKDNDLALTQESISHILGVRRVSITDSTAHLRQSGLINCSRGHISITNRPGLEQRACECYAVVGKPVREALQAMQPQAVPARSNPVRAASSPSSWSQAWQAA